MLRDSQAAYLLRLSIFPGFLSYQARIPLQTSSNSRRRFRCCLGVLVLVETGKDVDDGVFSANRRIFNSRVADAAMIVVAKFPTVPQAGLLLHT